MMSLDLCSQRVYLDVLGCRLNQSEIERMAGQFSAAGWELVEAPDQADLIIINTCAVTATAERKSRQAVRRAHRANGYANIVVTGCYAELAPERLASLPGVAKVVGNNGKEEITQDIIGQEIPPHLPGTFRSTRAFVKVQDGCDNQCAYCITTLLRGASRSRPPDEIIYEARALTIQGVKEIVLTGVHLGSYGRDLGGEISLRKLIGLILEETAIPRLRLSSVEPWDLTEAFFDLWQDSRLCPHFHLPLQSGCAATLRRMARRTTPQDFARLVEMAHRHISDLAITTDVIVGFPGETDAEFEESYRFVRAMDFARLHVFRYSPRPGTAAARMPDQTLGDTKRERARRLSELGQTLQHDYARRHIGREMAVLWEAARKMTATKTVWSGLTPNYIRATITTPASANSLYNTITSTRLVGARGDELVGEINVVSTPF